MATCKECFHYNVCFKKPIRSVDEDLVVIGGCSDYKPTADVVEVKHGEWKPIVKQDNYLEPPYCDTCKCSICGYVIDVCETVYKHCPHCGAKMDGERKDS